MSENVIEIENFEGPFKSIFHNVLRMVPDRDKKDVRLQRLIAFRLRKDGESVTREYLIGKKRDIIQCGFTGSFYDFLKDDAGEKECGFEDRSPDPLGA